MSTTLSPLEALKESFNPFAAREQLLAHLSAGTPLTPEDELTLKWHGLYRQRDVDGAGALMLRVKLAGGAISAARLRTVADIAARLAYPFVYLTTRQSIEFHGVPLAELPVIFPAFDAAGLTSSGSCGDVVRGVVACPAAGLEPSEYLDTTALVTALTRAFLDNAVYANLPRKLKIAVCGCAHHCIPAEVNDVALFAAKNAEGVWGYALHLGGGLSTAPVFAANLGVWVAPERVIEVVSRLAEIFRDYGNRESRAKARMKHLLLERGVEWLLHELTTRLGAPLPALPPAQPASPGWDHLGVYPQKEAGLHFLGIPVPVGRLEVEQLLLLAELAETVGAGRLRITHRQNVILSDIPTERVEEVLLKLHEAGLPVQQQHPRGHFVVCTGKEFCQKSIAHTKSIALPLLEELAARLPETGVTLGMSGCPNGCGQHAIADIGFSGAGVKGENGLEERFDLWVGGSPNGATPQFAQRIQRRLHPEELADAIENLVIRYRWEATDGEPFSAYAQRVLWEEAGGQQS
ncbi:MAG: nitrite/sulfite reductase [Armatimonadota bacterium]